MLSINIGIFKLGGLFNIFSLLKKCNPQIVYLIIQFINNCVLLTTNQYFNN